jgi:filamentous hemagglutinin family protein
MNANLFRLVFNAARGQVMAVSEVATACGKSANGETRSSRGNSGSNQPQAGAECAQAAIKIIVLSIASVCTLWAIPSAQAQIVADTTAAGNLRPMVSTTANGVPQVNIQTPSAAGVSRNVYSQFDVKANGAVLNNSSANVQTQLGGWVQGNSNLASGAARVILNEVNSSNPSQLNGFVEVAGQRAEVIIANPAGIAVNGGGFINASGVTLTTGAPQLGGGNLDGYRVQTGNVSFSGAGLDASTADYTHIIARAVQVNAGIWAKDLKVTTGANTVNAANTSATAIAGSGSAPTVALDVAALGGMYANKITLVGTEAGLGVNNAGSIAARSGDLVLQANGMLTNTGSMAATGNANLSTTGALSNTGTLQTGGKLQASAQTITNAVGASITSADMELTAAGTLTNRGLISSGNAASDAKSRITATTLDNLGTGAIYGDHLGMSATTLNNKAENVSGTVTGATIGARTSLAIGVQTLNNSDMGLDTPANPSLGTTATASTNILSLGNITVGASLDTAGQAQGTAASINNTSATIQAGGHIVLNATAINNTDAHFASVNQTTTTAISETLGSVAGGWYANLSQQTDSGPVVTAALPGTISAAGDITLNAASVDNANSKILAGGTLTIPGAVTVNNAGITATKTVTKTGTAYTLVPDRSCQVLFKGDCLAWGPWYDTWPASAYSDTVASTVTVGAGSNTSGATTAAPGVQSAAVPNSSLYRINTSPVASFLVATNPAFTNYKTWLGSDYMLQSLTLDPSVTQKRLGDGFYEQRLLNEQVAQLTGRRFLGEYTSDDQQYRALMNAGVTYANAFNLRPGIALSAEQVAQLTSDIVWLQQETVILPDGTKTVALVPQVYLALRSGDLAPSGALLSGAALHITSSGDTTNTGTILGRNVVQINANTVNNLGGSIRSEAMAITAAQDINNTGGTITAQNQLTLDAGRDINSNSTTASATSSAGNSTVTNTTVDRVAGLYVTGEAGILLASAGRDINLIASIVSNSSANGQTVLGAQRDINLGTVQTSQTSNQERDSGNFRRATSTAEAGTTIQTPGNIRLEAANDITARAAQLSAGKALDATAGNNIIVQAGQTTTQVDQMASASGSDLFTTSSIQTQRQSSSATAQRSTLGGQSVNVSAGNTLVSVGTEFKAGDRLKVEGKDQTLLYETQNVSQSSNTTHTTTTLTGLGAVALGGFGAQGLTLEDRTSTDQTASSVAMGTKLVSTQRIEIGVGNKTELRGTVVEAQEIAFVQTDPAKQGQLILGGSTNTTQTSHTEKTETAGVWQEQKGNGQTTQTLIQTQLKGNVQFDAALKITAQIPDTAGGQVLKTQINTLVSQGTGLDYLTQLSTNPSVQWDKVTLAHENWRYDQAGLTPAGAALLTVAVAVATGGAGATLTGTAGATGAAMSAGYTALMSQAAVSFANNGGDIGKTLEQLGKEDSIRNIATAMLTAGALDKLNTAAGWQNVNAQSTFAQQFQKNLTNNLASDMVSSALAGRPFDEATLANSLKGALITTGSAQGANAIGDAQVAGNLNAFTHKLAHAVLGCASATASGGQCNVGAVGAVVGELTAEYAQTSGMNNTDALALAKVIAATSGVITGGGGDNAQAVNIAATTGANAAENNYLKHAEALRFAALEAKAKAGTLTSRESDERAELIALDKKNQTDLNNACNPAAGGDPGSSQCKAQYSNLQQAATSYNNYQGMTAQDLRAELGNIGTIQQSLIMYNPTQPSTSGQTNRDRLTGLPLDDKGRYTRQVAMGDPINGYTNFAPKYFPCATTECVKTNASLDMTDPGTTAYVRALDAQVFKDINTGGTVATLAFPIGPIGNMLAALGPASSVAAGYVEEKPGTAVSKELLQLAAAQYLSKVHGLGDAVVNRITATIDLAGGWQAFIERSKAALSKDEK